MVHLVK